MGQTLRVATWNINSLRLRLKLLGRVAAELKPDVICLQETKVPDELFPPNAYEELGYPHVAYRGMKGYNGVAIFSLLPLTVLPETPDWCGKGDCRHIAVNLQTPGGPVELHDFYVPAGGDVPDRAENPKYGHKLDFVAEAADYFHGRKKIERAILVGDLNIAPLEHDVWSHKQLLDVVSHTPAEVEGLNAWMQTRFHDAMRHFVPDDQKLYTWWSYRNKDWKVANRGRRLDHIWVTPDLKDGLRDLTIHTAARDWEKGSDHVPVMLELEV